MMSKYRFAIKKPLCILTARNDRLITIINKRRSIDCHTYHEIQLIKGKQIYPIKIRKHFFTIQTMGGGQSKPDVIVLYNETQVPIRVCAQNIILRA